MDEFLEKLLTQTFTFSLHKNSKNREKKPMHTTRRNPKSSILTPYPIYSPKRHDLNAAKTIQIRVDWLPQQFKIMPKNKLERSLKCIGEFTGKEAVDILMATGTGGKLNETSKNGLWWKREHRQKRADVPRF